MSTGHHGAGRLEAVLRDLAEPDLTENDYEAELLALVRTAGLPAPVAQAPIWLGGRECRIDFLWPAERVALEADSYEFHGTRQAFERDRRRDQLLRLANYEPIRITARQLARYPRQVELLVRGLLGPRHAARPRRRQLALPARWPRSRKSSGGACASASAPPRRQRST